MQPASFFAFMHLAANRLSHRNPLAYSLNLGIDDQQQMRFQNTIQRPIELTGIAIFTNHDVNVRFVPANPNSGICFQRVDLAQSKPIPARIENAVFRHRRTAIEFEDASVEMIEHVMAALAGLQIDNCLIEIDGPEVPGFDGSSLLITNTLLDAGIVEQSEPAKQFRLQSDVNVEQDQASITGSPCADRIIIGYQLDFGADSPVPNGQLEFEITPEVFVNEIAAARTFVLESEVEAMRSLGYGEKLTAKDLLVFGQDGVIDNKLRWPDECIRHKILDCIGDLSLIGCELHGNFQAIQSGHALNREMVRAILASHNLNNQRQDAA